jgi:hypothetical protein
LVLVGGELIADPLYVRLLTAAPELSAALWPELIESLPFKVRCTERVPSPAGDFQILTRLHV